jgi:hypothetical protein
MVSPKEGERNLQDQPAKSTVFARATLALLLTRKTRSSLFVYPMFSFFHFSYFRMMLQLSQIPVFSC